MIKMKNGVNPIASRMHLEQKIKNQGYPILTCLSSGHVNYCIYRKTKECPKTCNYHPEFSSGL